MDFNYLGTNSAIDVAMDTLTPVKPVMMVTPLLEMDVAQLVKWNRDIFAMAEFAKEFVVMVSRHLLKLAMTTMLPTVTVAPPLVLLNLGTRALFHPQSSVPARHSVVTAKSSHQKLAMTGTASLVMAVAQSALSKMDLYVPSSRMVYPTAKLSVVMGMNSLLWLI